MPPRHGTVLFRAGVALLALLATALPASAQLGVVLSGVGPVNRSMGGAATAAPLDASGAIHWNPAAITGLGHSELGFGVELIYPNAHLSSSVAAGALGPGIPPISLSGRTRSDSGIFPIPTAGYVYQPEDSCLTYGLGVFTVGGFGANYPGSTLNPLLGPPPPAGIGLGAIYTDFQVVQIVPTVAYRLTDNISVGFAPTFDLAHLQADPAVFAAPDDADGDGFATFPTGTHTRYHGGFGVQAGVYATTEAGWNFGASVKSPQWFETFRFNSMDELGRPRTVKFHVDYPMILSLGTGYTGFDRWVLAADARYIDYKNTEGFDASGFSPTGAIQGLGWRSIFVLSLGAQFQLSDAVSLRAGYTYNMNPIRGGQTFFNVAAPTILENSLSLGASYRVTKSFVLSGGYSHSFENSISGPMVSPFGPIPRTSVRSTVSADSVMLGASYQF